MGWELGHGIVWTIYFQKPWILHWAYRVYLSSQLYFMHPHVFYIPSSALATNSVNSTDTSVRTSSWWSPKGLLRIVASWSPWTGSDASWLLGLVFAVSVHKKQQQKVHKMTNSNRGRKRKDTWAAQTTYENRNILKVYCYYLVVLPIYMCLTD